FPLDDHSRVRLQAIEGEQSSDYINANYIDVSMDTCQGLHTRVNMYGHCVCL
ncbi:protein-tyrosine phosphatase family protein, partial [Brucella melitensis]|uniref:protein-tyrosine phosphatase family protein n=1 Tax=Brucella melitensis TaxID=29459 RepID=UPI003B6812BA